MEKLTHQSPTFSLVLGCILTVSITTPTHAAANSFVVNTTQDAQDSNPGDGVCATALPGSPCSLRAAVQEANWEPGLDTIHLGGGLHILTVSGRFEDESLNGDLDIRGDLEIFGMGEAVTRIDGNLADRVFDMVPTAADSAPTLLVQDLAIQRGRAAPPDADGGCVRVVRESRLTLVRTTLRGCEAGAYGGAISVAGALDAEELTIIESDWDGLQGGSLRGGGIAVIGDGPTATLRECHLAENHADTGGAIFAQGPFDPVAERALIEIRNCSLVDNVAPGGGGAIHADAATDLYIVNTTMSGNSASNGGAIFSDGGSFFDLRHVTIVANQAVVGGGISEVHNDPSFVRLTNSIISDNLASHQAPNCSLALHSDGGSIFGDLSGCAAELHATDTVTGTANLHPLDGFGPASRTVGHRPMAGSVVIDAAIAKYCTPTDQRGVPRPVDGDGDGTPLCDSGAIERTMEGLFANGFEGEIEG